MESVYVDVLVDAGYTVSAFSCVLSVADGADVLGGSVCHAGFEQIDQDGGASTILDLASGDIEVDHCCIGISVMDLVGKPSHEGKGNYYFNLICFK